MKYDKKKLTVTVHAIDENGEILLTKEISRKEITTPTDISNFGYNRVEQLQIMEDIQQAMLDNQADFFKIRSQITAPNVTRTFGKTGYMKHHLIMYLATTVYPCKYGVAPIRHVTGIRPQALAANCPGRCILI